MKVGLFEERRSVALDELAQTLKSEGIETEKFSRIDAASGKIFAFDVLYFGGGWSSYNWLDLDARINIVEFVQSRGGGAIFSMFRCGWAARSGIRPIFPEVAEAYTKGNGRLVDIIAPDHPLTDGLPGKWLVPYSDCALMRLGPEGVALAVDGGGRVIWCCGDVGKGRVVFIGNWLGLNKAGKACYPMDQNESTALLNAVRWSSANGMTDHSTNAATSVEVETKVLRREIELDWLHDEHGRTFDPGILFTVKNDAETELDDLRFRVLAVQQAAKPGDLRSCGELVLALTDLQTDLVDRYSRTKDAFADGLQNMSPEELRAFRKSYIGRRERVDKNRLVALDVFQDYRCRIVPEQGIELLRERVMDLESRMPVLKVVKPGASTTAESIAQWVKTLKDGRTGSERANACLELGRIGDAKAVPSVLKALGDPDCAVRRNAVMGLAWMQAKESVPKLIELAKLDKDPRVRRRATQALGQIGDDRATKTLLGLLNDPDRYVRENAILGLGWLGAKQAVPGLVKILKAPLTRKQGRGVHGGVEVLYEEDDGSKWSRDEKVYALRALGHIGDKGSLTAIRECAESLSNDVSHSFYFTSLTIPQAATLAEEELAAGGRTVRGIDQPEWSGDSDWFDWFRSGYSSFLGRPFSYSTMPTNASMKAKYAVNAGMSGFIEDITFYAANRRQFGRRTFSTCPPVDDMLNEYDRLGLKMLPYWYRRGTAVIDKAGMEYDALTWGEHRSFGGYWAEEMLAWDVAFRDDEMFRAYIERKYDDAERRKLGLSDMSKVTCPESDDEGRKKKVMWAEYMEYLADRGVESWQEGADYIMELRKGTPLTFSLSQRYVQGKSTYISAYPRITELLGVNGPQSYCEHSYENNFHLDAVAEGGIRPAQGQFYAHQAVSPESVERGVASSFVHGQNFMAWWMGYVFKHPSQMGGCGGFGKSRWEAVQRQCRKGKALSQYLAPARNCKTACLLVSGRTATLTYGSGIPDGLQRGRPFRYFQNQQAIWQALMQSHLPVDVVWLETLTPERLKEYSTAILSDAVSLKESEEEMLRIWVGDGGVLVATGRSTTHDQWDRNRADYGLADVFGVKYDNTAGGPQVEEIENVDRELKPESGIQCLEVTDESFLANMDGEASVEYEQDIGYDVFNVQTGKVVAVWSNGAPAVVENAYGEGLSIFMSPVYPGLSHTTIAWTVDDARKEYWEGAREWLAACVRRGLDFAGQPYPLEVMDCPQDVEVVIKQQEDKHRWMIHLLSMDPGVVSIDGVKLKLSIPEGRKIHKVSYIYPDREDISFDEHNDSITFDVRRFDVHEMIVVEWKM